MASRQTTVIIEDISPIGAVTPWFIGQIFVNSTAGTVYVSSGLQNTEWVLVYTPTP